eukprot:CAMPEP_0171317414 /NCGR_PEP_ID=MMETSP0816-20121228/80484_1 /TAXON_ID=420281 /ORGANISM="Proboscia inermis, Strain CCAP1064/1" /LENGTH=57 /DNA_ID=CAMNT_0011810641 /DNA_START=26 /DNA_END=199 /DNA_ORIENTATION=+
MHSSIFSLNRIVTCRQTPTWVFGWYTPNELPRTNFVKSSSNPHISAGMLGHGSDEEM